jgi:predicted transcriptional regulator
MNGVLVPDQGSSAGRLGPLEAEVLGVLWRSGRPMSVREVTGTLNAGRGAPLAYTTVMTVMSRLARKGILARSRSGRVYIYAPIAADTAEIAVRGVLAEFGDAALARFVERVELDDGLRGRLRRLMEQQP